MLFLMKTYQSNKKERETMFCGKCGASLSDGAKFCPVCGAQIENAEIPAQPTETEQGQTEVLNPVDPPETPAPEFVPEQPRLNHLPQEPASAPQPPKKKKIGKIVGGICAAVVVAVAGVTAAAFPWVSNFVRRTVMSPEAYYSHVENKTFNQVAARLETGVDAKVPMLTDGKVSSEFRAEIDPTVLQLLSNVAGTDLSWINDASINADIAAEGDKLQVILAAALKNDRFLDWEILRDGKNVYTGLPQLSDRYALLTMDALPALLNDLTGMDLSDYAANLNVRDSEDYARLLPELIRRYGKAAADNLGEVDREKDAIETESGDVSCTRLTVHINDDSVNEIFHAWAELLEDDQDVKALFESLYPYEEDDFDEFYQEMIGELSDADVSFDEKVDYVVWIDAKGEVIGRALETDYGVLTVQYPEKRGDSYLSVTFKADNVNVGFSGHAKDGSGEWVLSYNKQELLEITTKDLKVTDGSANGSIKVAPGEDIGAVLSLAGVDSQYASMLENIALCLDFEGTDGSQTVVLSLKQDENALVALTGKVWENPDLEMLDPDDLDVIAIQDQDDIEEWASSFDLIDFLGSLPEEITSLIGDLAKQNSSSYYDDDYDREWYIDDTPSFGTGTAL